jgi:hypothetical protein
VADASFANVSLLLRCNGTDASTTFTDESSNAHTVTAVGNAQLDTAQKKYGTASALFDGTGDRLSFADAASLDISTGDFTVEFWVRFTNNAESWSNSYLLSQTEPSLYHPIVIYAEAPGGDYYTARLACYNTSNTLAINLSHATPLYENVWYHIAATRSSNTWRLFVDGASPVSVTSSATLKASSDAWAVGALGALGSAHAGWIDDVRITKGVARYTSAFTPPGEHELGEEPEHEALISAAGPLGAELILATAGRINAWASAPSPLGAGAVWTHHDWSDRVVDTPIRYVMDLTTPTGTVRVPISSWQATLQVDVESYVQCVVPSASQWTDSLTAATSFSIKRVLTLSDATIVEMEQAGCSLDTLQIDQGPTNYTATLSGYAIQFYTVADPPSISDRTLQGVRSISSYTSGQRVRCAQDFMLRPGQRAFYAETSLVVGYMNLYATQSARTLQAYMDVGERVV